MAARYRTWTPDVVRARIRVGMLIRRLSNHVLGRLEMSPTQIKAAEILLRKAVPDMRALEHSGQVNHVTYDAVVLGLISERHAEAGDDESAPTSIN